jgi:hypothetical protein
MSVKECVIKLSLLVLILGQTCNSQGFDKYQDALEKYRRWQERYAKPASADNFIRVQRQTKKKTVDPERNRIDNLVLTNVIPQDNDFGPDFTKSSSSLEPFNNVIDESQVNFLRPVRAPSPSLYSQGGPGSEYIHSSGVPLYKIRNRYPHGYGRKKRSASPLPQGWTILDPLTGRPKDSAIEIPTVVRRQRQPDETVQPDGNQLVDFVAQQIAGVGGSEYIDSSGLPLYKLRNQYPHGYGRKKRSAAAQGWQILDPLTGRPKDTSLEIPAVLRRERQPLDEGLQQASFDDFISRQLTNPAQQAYRYKYLQRNPYTG